MRRLITVLVISILCSASIIPDTFRQASDEALHFFHSHQPIIDSITQITDRPQRRVLAIVFPEMLRYNLLRDLIETTALEQLYTRYGSGLADFSIGHFQMKPSFVEELELHIRQSPELLDCYAAWISYAAMNERNRRVERIARLKQVEWQLIYACLFDAVVADCYGVEVFENEAKQIAFYATAYNCGFEKGSEYIEEQIDKRTFPYGPRLGNEQYNYAALSNAFYQHIFSSLSKQP